MRNIISKYFREEDGAAMVEYTALLGIITAAVILIILGVGGWVTTQWTSVCTNLAKSGEACDMTGGAATTP